MKITSLVTGGAGFIGSHVVDYLLKMDHKVNAAVNNNVKCFVFSSSIAVYGNNNLPLHEGQHPLPEDPYGIAKYAVEMDLKNAKEMFGMDYVIFRPHNVYGSRQNIADKYRNVVGIFMNQVLNGDKLTIFGDGMQSRAFTHVNDVAPYIASCVNKKDALNNTFNIGSDVATNVKELAEIVLKIMNSNESISYLEQRKEVVHAYSNHDKFKQVFNPKTNISLDEGLLEMYSWVIKNGAKKTVNFNEIEILKNLPKSWQ